MRRGKLQTELKLIFHYINSHMNFNIMPKGGGGEQLMKNKLKYIKRKARTKIELIFHLIIISASTST